MDRLGSKLLTKLKLTDSGSVKFSSSKKKNELANTNNNSNRSNTPTGTATHHGSTTTSSSTVATQTGGPSGRPSPQVTPSPTATSAAPVVPTECSTMNELHPTSLAQLRRPSAQLRASFHMSEGVSDVRAGGSGEGALRCDSEPQMQCGLSPRASLDQRRYSLELQQLVRRQQLLSQPPLSMPPMYPPHPSCPRSATESGFMPEPERHKRFSLQEALFYKRLSSGGGEPWDSVRPASLSHPPQRALDGAGGMGLGGTGGFFPPGGTALSPCSSFSLQESLLTSPRSSFASSTASGGGGGGGSPMGSRCSSNRTSGISLGYDSRYTPSGLLQQQLSSIQLGGVTSGQCYPYHGAGRPCSHSMEAWDYLEGATVGESRHSYPPATSRSAEGWAEHRAGLAEHEAERSRLSDLPGVRYQQELTRLLLRDAAREGEDLMGGLTLQDLHITTTKPTPTAAAATAAANHHSTGGPLKAQEESGAARESVENRQEFFGKWS